MMQEVRRINDTYTCLTSGEIGCLLIKQKLEKSSRLY